MIPTKTIQLDFWRHPTDILHLVQGEADGRKIQFKITDNGSVADLTGFIAIFAIRKPDGNIVVNSATITEAELGIVETTISSQVVTTAGNAHAELHLMKEGQLSKSFRIVTKVAPGVDIDGIAPSVSEFNALQTLIGQAETVISIADTELWPEVVENAQYFSDLAGAGRTTETVKGNANEIDALEAEIETARAGSATLGDALGLKADKLLLTNMLQNSQSVKLTGYGTTMTEWGSVTLTQNRKYYVARDFEIVTGTTGAATNSFRIASPTYYLMTTSVPRSLVYTHSGATITSTITAYGAIESPSESYFKNAVMIDLTSTFGAGNEPTAVEMDSLLTQFPNGWFDGTVEGVTLADLFRKSIDVAMKTDVTSLAGAGRTNQTVKANSDAIALKANATDLSNLAGTGRTTETVKANADAIANRALTLNNGAEQTVTDKNKYYPLLSNVAGYLMGIHQTSRWDGSAWQTTNGYGLGVGALLYNTGSTPSAFGHNALQNNTGLSASGFGYQTMQNNSADRSSGFGTVAAQYNLGFGATAVGYGALVNNTGANSVGAGWSALTYNQSPKNTAIGDSAYSTFLTNAAGAKTCTSDNINIADKRATITAHGFGADNAIVILRYTATTGTAIGGLALNTIFQVKIIDANTIEFVLGSQKRNLTSQGTGTHTFTPQFAYENTTCLGASTVPNKSNQVVLGDTNVDTVKMGGTARTPASATATGVKGEMCWDADYIYICVATNTWKRSALSTW